MTAPICKGGGSVDYGVILRRPTHRDGYLRKRDFTTMPNRMAIAVRTGNVTYRNQPGSGIASTAPTRGCAGTVPLLASCTQNARRIKT